MSKKMITSYIASGNVEKVKQCLLEGYPITSPGETPLHVALTAKPKNPSILKLLLDAGFPVDRRGQNGSTPLIVACQNGDYYSAELLLRYDAAINSKDNQGQSATFHAAFGGHYEIVTLLLNRKPRFNAADNNDKTPLLAACENGHLSVADLLMRSSANVHLSSSDGYNPLTTAASQGNAEMIDLIFSYRYRFLQEELDFALAESINRNHLVVAKKLIEEGADVNALFDGEYFLSKQREVVLFLEAYKNQLSPNSLVKYKKLKYRI
jgi:serine/threonine-protein phosphatase 6 regulatory ankyrin repeat subunit B